MASNELIQQKRGEILRLSKPGSSIICKLLAKPADVVWAVVENEFAPLKGNIAAILQELGE